MKRCHGVANRREDGVVDRRGTEIQVSRSIATFLGGSSPHSEKTRSFPVVSTTSQSSKTCSQVRGAEWADSAHASSQVICLSSPLANAHSSSQSPSEVTAPTQFGIRDSIQRAYEWSMRKCFLKGSSHSSGISAQQRGQPASELRGKWARATPMQVGMLSWQRTRAHREHKKSVELQMVFNTAMARQDAENAERLKWIACLSQLVAGTATPLGQRLVQRPAEVASMGLGLRAGTLRNRAHVLRRYFLWLAQSFRLPFPEQEEHYLDYLGFKNRARDAH